MSDDLFGNRRGWVPVERYAPGFVLDVMGFPVMGDDQLLSRGDGSAALALSMKRGGAEAVDIREAFIRYRLGRRGVDLQEIERAVAAMRADTARGLFE